MSDQSKLSPKMSKALDQLQRAVSGPQVVPEGQNDKDYGRGKAASEGSEVAPENAGSSRGGDGLQFRGHLWIDRTKTIHVDDDPLHEMLPPAERSDSSGDHYGYREITFRRQSQPNQEDGGREWLPIDSAPKDGTQIVLYAESKCVGVAAWSEWDDGSDGYWFSHTLGICSKPLGWQPVPWTNTPPSKDASAAPVRDESDAFADAEAFAGAKFPTVRSDDDE